MGQPHHQPSEKHVGMATPARVPALFLTKGWWATLAEPCESELEGCLLCPCDEFPEQRVVGVFQQTSDLSCKMLLKETQTQLLQWCLS